jgi:hypothetical protein
MLLEPGPIPPLAPDLSALQPEPAQFQQLTSDVFADLPDLESGLDIILGLFDSFDVPAEFDLIDLQLDTADEGLNELSAFSTSVYVDNADQAVTLAGSDLKLIAGDVPAEAWQPVPAPQFGSAGFGAMPGTNGPTQLILENSTRPGDTTFYAGDIITFNVQVDSGGGNFDFANKAIKLTRQYNGSQFTELDIGGTNDFGGLTYNLTLTSADVGDWVYGVDPPGFGTDPQVSYTVSLGGPGGAATPTLSATLENLSTGDAALFHPAEIWRETITGAAGQPVFLTQIKNGVDQGELFVGSTDATGALLIAGTISAASIGDYVERFRVGVVNVPTEITFSVQV